MPLSAVRQSPAARAQVLGVVLGLAGDLLLGDPEQGHPVAGFGRAATAWQTRVERDSRRSGVLFTTGSVGSVYGVARLLQRVARDRPSGRVAIAAGATWAALGGTTLRREGALMAAALDAGDLTAARERLPHLCGRDPAGLPAAELARATVESIAENTSDAVVAPLFWAAVGGVPGLLAYRAVNTLDAMVGHHTERYERFGWAAARLDDAANLVPARCAAALTVLAGPARYGALRAWLGDGGAHPSPNAGQVEAAFAGALGVRLGGRNVYAGGAEDRPVLNGAGRPVEVADVRRAVALSGRVSLAAAALTVLALLARRR